MARLNELSMRPLKVAAIAIATLLTFSSHRLQADLVMIEFTATATQIFGTTGYEPLPGLQVGSMLTGTYQYDTNPSLYDETSNSGNWNTIYLDRYPHSTIFNYTLTHNSHTREFSSFLPNSTSGDSYVRIRNEDSAWVQSDSFITQAEVYGDTYSDTLLLGFVDDSGQIFDDRGLPSSFDDSDFDTMYGGYTVLEFGTGGPSLSFQVTFDVTSVTATPMAVPEPGSALLCLATTPWLLLRRRR